MNVVKTIYDYNNFSIDDVLDFINEKCKFESKKKKKKKKNKDKE